jgi:hypothetical protein
MRRPAQHRPGLAAAHGWTHPYTGIRSLGVFYNDGGNNPAGEPNSAPAPKPGPPPQPTFTQEDLERIAAKEKSQGERAGARKALEDLAAELGFSNIDDAKAFVAAGRKAQQDALSEQERREQEVAERERKAADLIARAEARERAAIRTDALVRLGATGEDLEDAAALLRVADDADEQTVSDAAEVLKTRRPELFGAKTTSPASALPPAPGGAPAGGPPRTAPTKDDVQARARKRAEQMGFRRPDAA